MTKRILFMVAAAVLVIAGFYFRSSNAKNAHSQADRIVQLDTAHSPTAGPIDDLKAYVSQHMGSSVSFTLTSSYAAAQAAAKASADAAQATADRSNQIYADAQRACSGHSDSITQARCNQAYLAAHLSTAPTPAPVPAAKLSDYQYDLKAPFWTPDLPGALWLGAAAAIILGIISRPGRKI